MKNLISTFYILFFTVSILAQNNVREVLTLEKNWKFTKGAIKNAQDISFDDSKWETVVVPHDWAIKGPFDKEIDKLFISRSI